MSTIGILGRPLSAEHRSTESVTFGMRPFSDNDTSQICRWVKTRDALQLVSGDSADCLTPEILAGWVANARMCLVVSRLPANEPVGFCTLSSLEVPNLPAEYIELCHLVVDPQWRYSFIGSRLCRWAKSLARGLACEFLCGRVVPRNRYALALAKSQRFEEFTGHERWAPCGFQWFRFRLT